MRPEITCSAGKMPAAHAVADQRCGERAKPPGKCLPIAKNLKPSLPGAQCSRRPENVDDGFRERPVERGEMAKAMPRLSPPRAASR